MKDFFRDEHGKDRTDREAQKQPVCAGKVKGPGKTQGQADWQRCNKNKRQRIRQMPESSQQAVKKNSCGAVDKRGLQGERVGEREQ